ncbi:hypothetical protein SBOR_3468 [Sclerotinia borealis F-4128]|uniref:Uncharacterized protein n=1 Tax=Sclerotinia borealis (strain F-4128) TaxID=1432307 RepID=W9CJE8_SCLBF|nr:hypothetical protein SBOR_3468 [Sclerotinia borealis F-4128]
MSDADPYILTKLSEHISQHLNKSLDEAVENLSLKLQDTAKDAITDTREINAIIDQAVREAVEKAVEKSVVTEVEHASTESDFKYPPSRNLNFVGRSSTLAKLLSLRKPDQKSRLAVVGLGGIGYVPLLPIIIIEAHHYRKTELITELVYQIREASPASIYWFGPEALLTPSANGNEPLEDWLRPGRDSASLLVVDAGENFDLLTQETDNGRLIDRLRRFEGAIILITRTKANGCLLSGPHNIFEVGCLELEPTMCLLRDRLTVDLFDNSTDEQLREIALLVNCLPKAIIQISNLLNDTSMKPSQFISIYQTNDQFKLRLLSSVAPLFTISEQESVIGKGVLDARHFRRNYAMAARILHHLYYLSGNAVPRSIVCSLVDPLDLIIVMCILKGNFLVTEDDAEETYNMHPLVYLSLKKIITGERPETDQSDIEQELEWYTQAVIAFGYDYPDPDSKNREWWKKCFQHFLSDRSKNSDSVRTALALVYNKESKHLVRRGLYNDALKMATAAVDTLPEALPHEHLNVLQNHLSLLDLLAKYGELREALNTYTEEQPDELWKKRVEGILYLSEGTNKSNVVDLFRQIRRTKESTKASENDLCISIDDYGMALMLIGNYQVAEIEFSTAFRKRATFLGTNHPDTLISCQHLANVLHKSGRFNDALRFVEGAIRGSQMSQGDEHPQTQYIKNLKAQILLSKAVSSSDYKEVEALFTNAADVLASKLSDSHPLVLTCRSNIALAMLAQGRYDEALTMNRAVLTAREHGPWLDCERHPDILTSRHQIAECLRLKEGCHAAQSLSSQVLVDRTQIYTEGTFESDDFHPEQLTSLHLQALILAGLGQHSGALHKMDLVLIGRKRVLGESHPDYLNSLTCKGEILRGQLPLEDGREEMLDAIDILHGRALEGLTRVFGSQHHWTLQCLSYMAAAKRERGDALSYTEAAGLYRHISRAYEGNMGDLHPETVRAKAHLAEVMHLLGNRPEEAKKVFREACAGLAKVFGSDAHATITAYRGYEKFAKDLSDPA